MPTSINNLWFDTTGFRLCYSCFISEVAIANPQRKNTHCFFRWYLWFWTIQNLSSKKDWKLLTPRKLLHWVGLFIKYWREKWNRSIIQIQHRTIQPIHALKVPKEQHRYNPRESLIRIFKISSTHKGRFQRTNDIKNICSCLIIIIFYNLTCTIKLKFPCLFFYLVQLKQR